jgi:hypothetical protein
MGGHLFVVHGDVLKLACDAILIPSGTSTDITGSLRPGHVTPHWSEALGTAVEGTFLMDAPDGRRPVVRVSANNGIRDPTLWAGFTGDRADESPAFFARAVTAFVREAGQCARETPAAPRPLMSSKPLVALPLIGSGAGGRKGDKGALLLGIIDTLAAASENEDVDVVLVLRDATAYSAAQQARSLLPRERCWEELSDLHEEEALRLARLARAERLVPFLGAGASVGAGLPSWSDLLAHLAERAELSQAERDELRHLEHRDAGRILDLRLATRGGLAAMVCQETQGQRASLVHQLIASLPVTEAVTTNYDTLFESAWADAGLAPRVLPWEPVAEQGPWLLKLHGTVERPESIVLSRDDYLRFEGEGVALAGIVQAMLLTRHMLFVGYSLSDDNFHRLVHQVRTAIGSRERPTETQFGTALTPRAPSLGDDLWKGNVRFVSTADERGADDPRRTAIVLDRIGALAAAPAAYVLQDSYSALLTEEQSELGRRLTAVWELIDRGNLDPATTATVRDALELIGRRADP